MTYLNVEIKARLAGEDRQGEGAGEKRGGADFIRKYLLAHQADFRGLDEQTDTYFHVARGRLKLREGNIENSLIYYERPDQAGPKNSHFRLVKLPDASGLKEVLTKSLGIKAIVSKRREIYYAGNVKFHLDEVPGIGSFVEIEAGNMVEDLSPRQLKDQCDYYMKEFGIREEDLVNKSYSDMVLEGMGKKA